MEVVRLVVMMDSLVATEGSREDMAVVVVEGEAEEAARIMDHKEDHTEVEEGEVVVVVMEVQEDRMVVVEEEVVMVEEEVCS